MAEVEVELFVTSTSELGTEVELDGYGATVVEVERSLRDDVATEILLEL